MEQLLVTSAKLKQYRPTAEIPEERVGPFIQEAQSLDVKPMINELLWYDLIKNFEDAKYQTLLDGGEYTYQDHTYYFEGLGAVIAYYALARLVGGNQIHITSFSVVQKVTAQSTPVDPTVIAAEVSKLRAAALGYSHEVKKFLERNPVNYPLYRSGGEDIKQTKRTGFKIYKG